MGRLLRSSRPLLGAADPERSRKSRGSSARVSTGEGTKRVCFAPGLTALKLVRCTLGHAGHSLTASRLHQPFLADVALAGILAAL
jgi:hypothetical protein